jgi:phage tail sheath protein FI
MNIILTRLHLSQVLESCCSDKKLSKSAKSALDRINVRRLVIFMKKQISILSTQVLFEQNVQATWNRFKGLIEPFLSNVQTRFGITEYKLILDETTTTPDLIDQNVLYAKIMIKPARAIEFIAIDFVIARTGASFDD